MGGTKKTFHDFFKKKIRGLHLNTSWIAPVEENPMGARIATMPTRDEIDRSINEQLIVELYSK